MGLSDWQKKVFAANDIMNLIKEDLFFDPECCDVCAWLQKWSTVSMEVKIPDGWSEPE